jgi:type IV secretion system protein VirD4
LGLVRESHLDEDLDMIFKTLIPDSNDPLWADGSRNVAKMLAMFEILELKKTPTLQGIYETICDRNFSEKIPLMVDEIKTQRVANLFGKFLSTREKTQKDLLLNAQEYLSKFDSPNLAYATNGNDFDFKDLRKIPMTIYLIMPANTETFGPIAAIFFEQMIRLTTENNEPGKEEYSINAFIDEFGNLPKMPSIAKGISFLRSYRIRVCAFTQHIAQLKAVYGEESKEGFLASPLKLAFNITSKQDADYFSALAGKKTVTLKNESFRGDFSLNISSQKQLRELIQLDEIMRMSRSKLLIFRAGFQVVKAQKNFGN